MKLQLEDTRQVISQSWAEREQILQRDVNLFCWSRSVNEEVRQFLNHLLEIDFDPVACPVSQQGLKEQLALVQDSWIDFGIENSDAFFQDLSEIVFAFLNFSQDRSGTMYLRKIDHNACSKFHTDGYYLRLFCTYSGPGTEWLTEDNVDREALGTSNDKIVRDQNKVRQMRAGDVGILKGDLFKYTGAANGIVHRSPEIADTGEQRIILRVDIN